MIQNPSASKYQRGIALMLVLWIIVLLTIIAVALTGSQRTETTLATNQLANAEFRALADAAINYAALNLLATPPLESEEDPDAIWLPDAQPRTWSFAGSELEIRVINESSLIDLNVADRSLLGSLLYALGVEAEQQDMLLDAILDWRDLDDAHLLNGAEDPDYEAAGRPHGAKDGPFDSVEELRQVLGFNRALCDALKPALSAYSGQAKVVAEFAPPLVRAALEGLTLEEMEVQLEEEAAADLVGDEPAFLNRGGPLYRIRVKRETRDGAFQAMEALVYIQPSTEPPVSIRWRRYALSASLENTVDQETTDTE